MVIRERYHRLDTLFDAKIIPIAVGIELRSELRNRPLCIRFHDLALRTYSSCCVPPNLCLLNCPRNSIAPGGHKPRGRQWEQFLPIQKRLRAALACCARRWGMRSRPGWKIPPSSRSCSIRTAGCESTAWPEASATREATVGGRRRAHPSCRRPPGRRRGPFRVAAHFSRTADRRALRRPPAANRQGGPFCHSQACSRDLYAWRLRPRRHHDGLGRTIQLSELVCRQRWAR